MPRLYRNKLRQQPLGDYPHSNTMFYIKLDH